MRFHLSIVLAGREIICIPCHMRATCGNLQWGDLPSRRATFGSVNERWRFPTLRQKKGEGWGTRQLEGA